MKPTNLKEIYLVRYADDFKIFCRDYKTAQKIFIATKNWLKERLDLEISTEKSKVTNVRKNHTEYLGIKLKVEKKKEKFVCQSKMCDKAISKTIEKLKEQVKKIQKKQCSNEVSRLNAMILGSQNYYKMATQCVKDFGLINFLVTRTLDNRLKGVMTNKPKFSESYKKLYGNYHGVIRTVQNVTIFPIYGCKTKNATSMTQKVCNYTIEGRELVHEKIKGYKQIITYLLNNNVEGSVEYNDNRVSLIVGQRGKCGVTGNALKIGMMECHHKKPKELGGSDEYKNLIWMTYDVHKLVHCTIKETIDKYLNRIKLDEKGLESVNALRKLVGNSII